MSVEFLTANFLVNIAFPLAFMAVMCWLARRWDWISRRAAYGVWAAFAALILYAQWSQTAPRFVITDHTRPAPAIDGGEVRNLRKEGQTDQERLETNRRLYEENRETGQ